jgi:hypothetical protein
MRRENNFVEELSEVMTIFLGKIWGERRWLVKDPKADNRC